MTKYYVRFKERQLHEYTYCEEADSPEKAFELAEDKYFNDEKPDYHEMLDCHYATHSIEE
jgi:hypothetical protein